MARDHAARCDADTCFMMWMLASKMTDHIKNPVMPSVLILVNITISVAQVWLQLDPAGDHFVPRAIGILLNLACNVVLAANFLMIFSLNCYGYNKEQMYFFDAFTTEQCNEGLLWVVVQCFVGAISLRIIGGMIRRKCTTPALQVRNHGRALRHATVVRRR